MKSPFEKSILSICLATTITLSAGIKAKAQYLEFAGAGLFSNPNAVKIVGNYAYCAYTNGFVILDISDPSTPTPSGQIGFEGPGNGVDVQGNFAFVANGSIGLTIIDISNPDEPVQTAALSMPGNAVAIDVDGDYAYVAARDPGVVIANISDPHSPVISSTFNWAPYSSSDVAVIDTILYAVSWYDYYGHTPGCCVALNVAEPASPTLIGSFNTLGPLISLTISDSLMLITTNLAYAPPFEWNAGFLIYEIGDPFSIRLLGRYEEFAGCYDIEIDGNLAYLADGDLRVIDISDPSSPEEVGFLNPPANADRVAIMEDNSCLLSDKIYTFDRSVPSNPQILGDYGPFGSALTVFVDGNYAYVDAGGLRIMDISDPARQVLVASYQIPAEINDIFVSDNFAYLSSDSGLTILDVSNPASPFQAANLTMAANDIFVSGEYCYVVQNGSFTILDISNPFMPSDVGGLRGFSSNAESYIVGNYAFVADNNLKVIDIVNRTNPVLRVNRDIAYEGYDIAILGNYAYVSAGGLLAIDISDPLNPNVTGSYQWVGPNADIAADGCKAFVAEDNLIKVLDITNPSTPIILQNYLSPGMALGVIAENGRLYVADHDAFLIYSFNPIGIEDNANIIPDGLNIAGNYPNPFNARTTIKYTLPSSSVVHIDIFDITGRKIETLISEKQSAGEHSIVWNAGDKPSGVYFYRIKAGEFSKTQKCLLLK
jgi:hypothetical protein